MVLFIRWLGQSCPQAACQFHKWLALIGRRGDTDLIAPLFPIEKTFKIRYQLGTIRWGFLFSLVFGITLPAIPQRWGVGWNVLTQCKHFKVIIKSFPWKEFFYVWHLKHTHYNGFSPLLLTHKEHCTYFVVFQIIALTHRHTTTTLLIVVEVVTLKTKATNW